MRILRLYREACIDPGGKPAQQCLDTRIAIIQKEERRTGARMFILSGTVCDDPLVFLEREACDISFDLAQRNGDRAHSMALFKGIWTAHIYEDRRAAVECCFCFFEGHARDFSLGERKLWFVGSDAVARWESRRRYCRRRSLRWLRAASRHDRDSQHGYQ